MGCERKIAIVGDGGVGKSTLIKKVDEGLFEEKHVSTVGIDIYFFNTPYGKVEVKDTAGREYLGGRREGYLIDVDVVIVLYDSSKGESYRKWVKWLRKFFLNMKIVRIGNKSDLIPNPDGNQISVKNSTSHELREMIGRAVYSI